MIDGTGLTVNARIVGALAVRIVDAAGNSIAGFDWQELSGDSVAHPLKWPKGLGTVKNRPVRLEFRLTDAQLFGFDLVSG